jgi:hypothetical protein
MRRFTEDDLRKLLLNSGFEVEICTATNLNWFGLQAPASLLDWSPRSIGVRVADACRSLVDRLRPARIDRSARYRRFFGTGPHLIGIARSP